MKQYPFYIMKEEVKKAKIVKNLQLNQKKEHQKQANTSIIEPSLVGAVPYDVA